MHYVLLDTNVYYIPRTVYKYEVQVPGTSCICTSCVSLSSPREVSDVSDVVSCISPSSRRNCPAVRNLRMIDTNMYDDLFCADSHSIIFLSRPNSRLETAGFNCDTHNLYSFSRLIHLTEYCIFVYTPNTDSRGIARAYQ